jgi:hypothetical protein
MVRISNPNIYIRRCQPYRVNLVSLTKVRLNGLIVSFEADSYEQQSAPNFPLDNPPVAIFSARDDIPRYRDLYDWLVTLYH